MGTRLHHVGDDALVSLGTGTVGVFPPIRFGSVPQSWTAPHGDVPEFELDLTATGAVSVTDVKLYGGTESALTIVAIETTGEADDDTLNATGHGLYTGDGPFFIVNDGGALPDGIVSGVLYYVIRVDADTLRLAITRELAGAGIYVELDSDGTGTQNVTSIEGVTKKIVWHQLAVVTAALELASNREGFSIRENHSPRVGYYGLVWSDTAANPLTATIAPIEDR